MPTLFFLIHFFEGYIKRSNGIGPININKGQPGIPDQELRIRNSGSGIPDQEFRIVEGEVK
jgi:hypothetical protein